MTDPLDLDALEATARAATPFVRYEIDDPNACFIAGTDPGDDEARIVISDVYDKAVAAHIAAFDPPTVLALIERLREVEADRDFVAKSYDTVMSVVLGRRRRGRP